MPYPTVVTDSAATQDKVNQFRTYASQLPDPAQPQIDADTKAYNAHVAKLGDVTQPATSSASSSSAAVSTSTAAPSYGPIDSSSRQAFVQSMMPYAQLWEQKTGIPASTWIAMGASESNWGKAGGNELFGIKGGGNAGSLNSPTWESVNGKRVNITDNFAAYQTPNDAFQGFWNLVQGQRYAPAMAVLRNGGSGYDFVRALNNAGYATDPNWAESIRSIANNQIGPALSGRIGPSSFGGGDLPYTSPGTPANDDLGNFQDYVTGLGDPSAQLSLGDGSSSSPRRPSLDAPTPSSLMDLSGAYGNPPSSFGSNPEDASSPIDQARSQGQTRLPDFAGMASSALGSVGGLVSSMLPKPADQGFSLPSSNSAAGQPYNDMAGASSSPLPVFGTNPEDASSPIEQNRVSNPPAEASPFTLDWPSVTVPTNKKKPVPMPQLLAGESPLTDLGNQIVQGERNRLANQGAFLTPTLGTRADQPAREQVTPTAPGRFDLRAGYTPSQQAEQQSSAANIAMGSTGIEKVGAPSVVGEGKPFYSALAQAIETKVQPRGTVEQAKAALVNAGVKPIEMAITGLDDYLASKAAGAKVTRTELQDFVAKNAVDVREVVKGGQWSASQDARLNQLDHIQLSTGFTPAEQEEFDALNAAKKDAVSGQTKYGSYVTPGADPGSYRELLLTTPKADPAGAAYDFRKSLTDKYGDGIMNKATPEEIQQLNTLDRAAQAPAAPSYQSSHYDEPNILAHVRFNTRTDASGAKVLHVEEIQSDWAQAGRKNPGSVPPTPFANTADWAALAFKRVLRYAADNGYDKVTWTTGAQQNARYSLSNTVDRLEYDPQSAVLTGYKNGARTFDKDIMPEDLPATLGHEVASKLLDAPINRWGGHTLTGQQLEVGGSGMKGFYDTILPSVANTIGKKFGARVGEAGVLEPPRIQYNPYERFSVMPRGGQYQIHDRQTGSWLPQSFPSEASAMNHVGTLGGSTSATVPVHSFTIPPAMKASVQKGQTLYTPPAVGGAIVGGLAGATQPAQTPQERAKNIAVGAAAGGVGAYGLQKLGEGGNLARLASEDVGAVGRVPRTAAPGEQRAGNILLRKFDPGVQDVIAEAAAKDPAGMEAARRGVVSDATVQDLAAAAGTTVNKVIARWKPGDIANAETITAMKSALQSKAQEASDLAKTAVATPSAANDLNLALAVHEQNAIQAAVSGGTAELGRGLRALRASVQDAIQSGQPEQMQAVLKRMGGPEWTADLAKKLTQIDPTDVQARYDFLRNALKPTLKNDLTFLWYNAMLSGPHTVAVKTMSEILSLAASPLERGAAAVADLPLSAMRGGGRQRFFGEVPADAVGMAGGIREGVSKALYTMQHGYSMSDVLNSDYIRPRTSFSPGVERVLGSPSRILAAGVDMMSSIAQAGAINAGAYRQASIEGLKGPALAERIAELRANPTKSLAQYAKDQGIYRTFQTEPVRGSLMQRIGDIRSAEWHGIPVARIIVPFWQTPINLMKQGLERSPMGLFNPAMIKEVIAKDPKAADSLGRALLGSGVATAIALHVGAGNITGPAPATPAEADAWRRQGKTAWSMKIGDKWVNYQKVPFIAQSLGQVASIVDSINKGQDVGSAAGQLAAVIGANMTTEPYMQGISTLMNAMSNPTQFGDRMISGLATSVIPAGVRVIAQNMDPTVRQTSTVPEAMQADIPGLSQNLPPRLNAFGESQNRLTSNISPIGVSQATSDPVDTELTRYGVEPGFTGKTLRGMDLTRQEQADHQRIAGQLVKQVLTQLIADPRYKGANDLDKARALQMAITHAKDAAARQYLTQLAQSQGTDTLIRRIQQKKMAALPRAG